MKRSGTILAATMFLTLVSVEISEAGYLRGRHFKLDDLYIVILSMEKKRPGLVSIEQYGKSVEGRSLLAIKIARRDGKKRPDVLVTGNIHATEFTGDRLAIAVAEKLIEQDGIDPWVTSLLDRMDFYVLPLLNPDGYARASDRLDRGFTTRRTNADEVDLNRNFPYPKGIKPEGMMAGSHCKLSPNYMGAHPLSEPETKALDDFVSRHRFFTAINFHTTGGHFVYPWGYMKDPCPDKGLFDAMGKALNEHQNLKKYKVHQAFDWYQTVGDADDWFYGKYGVLSVTVEVAKKGRRLLNPIRFINPFWWYNPTHIEDWVGNDRDAVLYAIEKALELTGGEPRPPQQIKWHMS